MQICVQEIASIGHSAEIVVECDLCSRITAIVATVLLHNIVWSMMSTMYEYVLLSRDKYIYIGTIHSEYVFNIIGTKQNIEMGAIGKPHLHIVILSPHVEIL